MSQPYYGDPKRFIPIAAVVLIVGLAAINLGVLWVVWSRDGNGPAPPPTPVEEVRAEVVAAAQLAGKARSLALSEGYRKLAESILNTKPKHASEVLEGVNAVIAAGDAAATAEVGKVTDGLPDGELGEIERRELAKFFRSLAAGFAEVAQ